MQPRIIIPTSRFTKGKYAVRNFVTDKGVECVQNLRKFRGDIYDKFRLASRGRLARIFREDLHAYVKFVGMLNRSEVLKKVSNEEGIEHLQRDMIVATRGLEWFHNIILDEIRYILRDSYEDIREIPFHSPLKDAIYLAEEKKKPVAAYWPSSKHYNTPMVEMLVQSGVDEHGIEQFTMPEGFPRMDGYERMMGLCIVIDPRSKLLFFGIPRGRLKSAIMAGVHGWYAERNPDRIQAMQSFNISKVMDHLGAVRSVLENSFGRSIFCERRPARKSDNKHWTKTDMTLIGEHRPPSDSDQIFGRSIYQDVTGSHPDFIAWDDVECKEAMKGLHFEKLIQHLHETFTNLLNRGGSFIVTGTIWREDGPHSGLISRKVIPSANVIAASWEDIEGHSISRRFPTAEMLHKKSTTPPDEFARNHELRNYASEDAILNPKLVLANSYTNFSKAVGVPFDRVVIVTDTTKTDGTSRGADYMAGCALGLRRSAEEDESDEVVLLGIYHTKPGSTQKGIIYASWLLHVLNMVSPEYSANPCYRENRAEGTGVDRIYDYIETDGETDMSLAAYRRIADQTMNSPEERFYAMDAELEGVMPGLSDTTEKKLGVVKNPYIPRLLPVSAGKRKKADRIAAMAEALKSLAIDGKFVVARVCRFKHASVNGVPGSRVNQIDELRREMAEWDPNRKCHDDMIDAIAHALEVLSPRIYRRVSNEPVATDKPIETAHKVVMELPEYNDRGRNMFNNQSKKQDESKGVYGFLLE